MSSNIDKLFAGDQVLIITTNNLKIKGKFYAADETTVSLKEGRTYPVDSRLKRVPGSKCYTNGDMTVGRANIAVMLRYGDA